VTELRGRRVVLRAFRADEIDEATSRMAGGGTVVGETSERERRRRDRLERSGARNAGEILFAIESERRLIGDAQGRCIEMAMPPGVWEVGLEIWDDGDRGRGLGRETVELLASHLFTDEGAIRVQATTDVDNTPMRRVLDGLGFGFEGVLHGFMPSPEGPPRDYAMYGVTRSGWRAREGSRL
jgi:RimJ/RimL family protein N-acetyltransferase